METFPQKHSISVAMGNEVRFAQKSTDNLRTVPFIFRTNIRIARRHSFILAYDWTHPGDADTVVEDIERLDLDFFEWHSGDVMEEWFTLQDESAWLKWRIQATSKVDARLMAFHGILTHEVGELYLNPRDGGQFLQVMRNEVLKSPYGYGYIRSNGDPMQGMFNWRLHHDLPEPW
ncbi:hypothetical protein DICVIV_07796 [Dictyocaulus viviparus]|uniref:Uncharacterized protein n=1 Tax=Dictyocaulus viviparus TaxID=29172 RepID=A0A0D8XNB7_DICVI|nr:hypothetical protein DICVIV_07796 [Dictyocaulus viviparus]